MFSEHTAKKLIKLNKTIERMLKKKKRKTPILLHCK